MLHTLLKVGTSVYHAGTIIRWQQDFAFDAQQGSIPSYMHHRCSYSCFKLREDMGSSNLTCRRNKRSLSAKDAV